MCARTHACTHTCTHTHAHTHEHTHARTHTCTIRQHTEGMYACKAHAHHVLKGPALTHTHTHTHTHTQQTHTHGRTCRFGRPIAGHKYALLALHLHPAHSFTLSLSRSLSLSFSLSHSLARSLALTPPLSLLKRQTLTFSFTLSLLPHSFPHIPPSHCTACLHLPCGSPSAPPITETVVPSSSST